MTRRLKNTTAVAIFHVNSGVSLAVGYNDINSLDAPRMLDAEMFSWFSDGTIVFNDGSDDFSDSAEGWARFSGSTQRFPVDSDGSAIQRYKTTKTGWHYEPRSLDWSTSTHKSLYNRKHDGAGIDDGTDYGDAHLLFYDASGAALVQGELEADADFQVRLTANCIKSIMSWQPAYDMDIIGGIFQVKNIPVERAYLWTIIAPDIPEASGGNVPHASGGWNLQFFKENDTLIIDGRGSKTISYDPVYNSNKFHMIIKHGAGAKIDIQMIYDHFKQ